MASKRQRQDLNTCSPDSSVHALSNNGVYTTATRSPGRGRRMDQPDIALHGADIGKAPPEQNNRCMLGSASGKTTQISQNTEAEV